MRNATRSRNWRTKCAKRRPASGWRSRSSISTTRAPKRKNTTINPDRQHLIDLGYKPTHDVVAEMRIMLKDLLQHKERILAKRDILIPDIRWDGTHRRSHLLDPQTAAVNS